MFGLIKDADFPSDSKDIIQTNNKIYHQIFSYYNSAFLFDVLKKTQNLRENSVDQGKTQGFGKVYKCVRSTNLQFILDRLPGFKV